MQLIAYIVIFSLIRGSLKNLVVLSLQRMVILTGKKLRTILMVIVLARLTIMLG
jgi:hypothetical protein